MIKFILVLITTVQPDVGPTYEVRDVWVPGYETRAACMLSGEVEASHLSSWALGGKPINTDIECHALEIPDGAY